MNSSIKKTELIHLALNSRQFSHSPYSTKKIGAAIQLSNGQIFTGCNIENASYGGTVCAERVAIWKAFSENANHLKIIAVAVASDEKSPWPPCGLCRQVMAEFSTGLTEIYLVNTQGQEKTLTFAELFPYAFEPDHLLKK